MLTQIQSDDKRFAVLGLGIIDWKAEIDKYANHVSIITLPDGMRYRMVHHRSTGTYERATIYAGRNKFLRYTYRETQSDRDTNNIELGKFSMAWGDGDPGWVEVDPTLPESAAATLRSILGHINENGDEQALFILNVLMHAANFDSIWQSKEV